MTNKVPGVKYGLSLDWETSGLNPLIHQGIQLGAAIFNQETLEVVETFKVNIQFNSLVYIWDDVAEAVHGISREFLEKNGVGQKEAALMFLAFIDKYFEPKDMIVLLGYNPLFDMGFTRQLMLLIECEFSIQQLIPGMARWIRIYHILIDVASAGFVIHGTIKSDRLFEKLGFPPRGKHDALEDVLLTLRAAGMLRKG